MKLWQTAVFTATAALLGLALSTGIGAQANLPSSGNTYFSHQCDLNHDGIKETISLVAYNCTPDSYFGQLVVTDPMGKPIWLGPKPTTPGGNDSFGGWMFGVADIQYIGDIDTDGQVEIVGAMPQSDVRPTAFRVWRWKNNAFKRVFVKCLVEKPKLSGHYVWTKTDYNYDRDRWISNFTSVDSRTPSATIVSTNSATDIKGGSAVVCPTFKGFNIVRWRSQPQ